MPEACRGFWSMYAHWSKYHNLHVSYNFAKALPSPQSMLHSHLPVGLFIWTGAELRKQNLTVESWPYPHIFLCRALVKESVTSPGPNTHTLGRRTWAHSWQRYSHLVHEGHGGKLLLPFTAAFLSNCQLKQHSPPTSPGLLAAHPRASQAAGPPVRPAWGGRKAVALCRGCLRCRFSRKEYWSQGWFFWV